MKHNHMIEYDGIKLRPLENDDLELLRGWRNQVSIRKCFIDQTIIESEQQLKWYQRYLDNPSDIFFIIEETRRLQRPVGAASLYQINYESSNAEFGRLMIGDTEALGMGIGKKTLDAICDFGFKVLQLETVYLEVLETNTKAINIYQQAGFVVLEKHRTNNIDMLKMVKGLSV